jgi:beta-lactamase class D
MQMTRNLLLIEEWPVGWKLYGKTGSCSNVGWFVGWIENKQHFFPFAYQGPLCRSERILRVKQLISLAL